MNTLIEKALALATAEVGVEEQPRGSNWGTKRGPKSAGCVTDYIKAGGYDEPVFWCACFTFWTIAAACQALGVSNPVPRTGSCDLILAWAHKKGVTSTRPKPGDQFLVMASASDAVHTGFVIAVSEDGKTLTTIEGNSNNDGSSNGYAVVRRTRKATSSLLYVRWADAVEVSAAKAASASVSGTVPIQIGRGSAVEGALVAGEVLAPVRAIAARLGFGAEDVAWDADTQGVRIKGTLLAAQITLRGGVAYAPVAKVAAFFGLGILGIEGGVRLVRGD